MNALTRQVVDVYHRHALSEVPDVWSRLHLHGLNRLFLKEYGLPNEAALVHDFKQWLSGKDVLAMYGNDPGREMKCLGMNIKDMEMPKWAERSRQPYHEIALAFKNNFVPILEKRCCAEAHASFSKYPMMRHNVTELAKFHFGFHCSLYDAYELYLCYICN